jgi:uncharacterized protein YqgC (DUF456 family)
MSPFGEVVIGLVMAIGLVGTIVPVLPGVTLVWGAGLAWAILDGGDFLHWSLFAVMTIFFISAHALGIYLPSKTTSGPENPKWTFLFASLCAVIGFFVVPIIGVPLGFIVGVFIRQLIASREFHRALGATGKTLRALGIVVLVQCACAIAIAATWAIGLFLVK